MFRTGTFYFDRQYGSSDAQFVKQQLNPLPHDLKTELLAKFFEFLDN
jgi:hypothetical protein